MLDLDDFECSDCKRILPPEACALDLSGEPITNHKDELICIDCIENFEQEEDHDYYCRCYDCSYEREIRDYERYLNNFDSLD